MTVLNDRFRLEARIGEGALATVWRARDLLHGQRVAIKCLKADAAASPAMRRRLRREARAVQGLDHPNIVRAVELADDAQGHPFLALELVTGEPFARALEQGTRPLGYLFPVIDQILSALAYAHARGVVHRDLNPHNVVVTRGPAGRPQVKLLDFGFARFTDETDSDLDRPDETFGSPSYMSPEQADGAWNVGPSTDLYAVAAIAWEAFAGAPPFDGRTATQVLMQHLNAPLPPFVPRAGLDVPPGLVEWLRRGLAKQPGQRFASAGSMRRGLARLFDHESETLASLQSEIIEVRPEADEATGSFTDASLAGVAEAQRVQLVGRESMRTWLWDAVRGVCESGEARCLIMEGEAGVGTSRLGEWVREAVAEQGWMQTGRGRWRRGHVLTGLSEALTALWDLQPDQEGLQRLFGSALSARDIKALAWWFERPTRRPPDGPLRRALTCTARRQPVFLMLDGFDRAPALEREAVGRMVAGLRRARVPVLLVLAAQTPSPGLADVEGPVDELLRGREDGISLRRVRRLSRVEIVELLSQRVLIHPHVAQAIANAARGVALYAVLAVELLEAEGAIEARDGLFVATVDPLPLPRTVGELARAWLLAGFEHHRQGRLLRDLAERLAVVGEAFPFALVELVGGSFGLDTVTLEMGIDGLVRLGVLEDVAQDAFAFRHPIVRRAVLDGVLGRTDAAPMHERVAEAKAQWQPDADEPLTVEIAAHYRAAGKLARAVDALLLAARRAERTWRLTRASTLYARAERWLDQLPDPDRLARLRLSARAGRAAAALAAGEWSRAARLARRLAESARQLEDTRQEAEAIRIIASARLREGRVSEAARVLAGAALPDDPGARAGFDLIRARIEARRGALETGWSLAKAAVERFRVAADSRHEAEASLLLGELSLRIGDRAQSRQHFEAAGRLARAAGDDRLVGRAGIRLGDLLRSLGELRGAVPPLERGVEAFERVGDAAGIARARRALGDVHRSLGQLEQAVAWYRAAADDFRALGDRFQRGVCLTQIGRLALCQGALLEAQSVLEAAAAAFDAVEDDTRRALVAAYQAQAAHRRGHVRQRDTYLAHALRADTQQPLVSADFAEILEEVAISLAETDARRAPLWGRARVAWLRVGAVERAERCAAFS